MHEYNKQDARLYYDQHGVFNPYQLPGLGNTPVSQISPFSRYSPAYIATNENVRNIINIFGGLKKQHTLINTGSGDGPLFALLSGATQVDTFDISYCAKAMMDIKKSALKVLDYEQYILLLHKLHKSADVRTELKNRQIMHTLPENTQCFISDMHGCKIFANGFDNVEYTINQQEFLALQKKQLETNFIWAKLEDLTDNLSIEYDFIYLSNIFQYERNAENIATILNRLGNYLKKGGFIIVDTQAVHIKKYEIVKQSVKEWACAGMLQDARMLCYALQKNK